jgi:hypothetical protein
MIIIFWEITPCYFPEDDNHQNHRRGNLKSYRVILVYLFGICCVDGQIVIPESQQLLGEAEENPNKPQDTWRSGRDSNQAPPNYF